MFRWLLLVGSITLVAVPCSADWQFTQWGMSEPEFEAACVRHSQARECKPLNERQSASNSFVSRDLIARYRFRGRVAGMNVGGIAQFRNGTLAGITLYLGPNDAASVRESQTRKFGRPEEATDFYARWIDRARGDVIEWRKEQQSENFSIHYEPIEPADRV